MPIPVLRAEGQRPQERNCTAPSRGALSVQSLPGGGERVSADFAWYQAEKATRAEAGTGEGSSCQSQKRLLGPRAGVGFWRQSVFSGK